MLGKRLGGVFKALFLCGVFKAARVIPSDQVSSSAILASLGEAGEADGSTL